MNDTAYPASSAAPVPAPRRRSWPLRVLGGLWRGLDALRRALLNLLLLAIVAGIAWLLLKPGVPALKPGTALVIDLHGPVVEQTSVGARERAMQQIQGEEGGQTRLRDVLAVLDAAAKDDNIPHALLMLDEMQGTGLATLREISAALARFKAGGKKVYAWGSSFDQAQYYLAAQADEVWLHPMGQVEARGYGRQRSYFKDLFDKVGVDVHVVRAGQYKNALETFAASGPSPQTVESDAALYGSMWATWTGDVERARKQPAGSLQRSIASLPASLEAVGGDLGRWTLEQHWVDALKTRDEMRAELIAKGHADADNKGTFGQIGLAAYLERLKPAADGGDAVGIIVAQGTIGDGRSPPGSIGGLSTAELVRQARDDDKIKALVLRVDSPGGSAFGSELVRRELELTRKAGKPVVVSMGDVAASGGYWISLASDEIIADPATITGSIGVIGMLPSAEAALDRIGVHTAGAGTTWLAGQPDPRRALDPRFEQLVRSSIGHIYGQFTTLAAAARKSTPEKIDAIGQGRVWSGQQALERGLVDRLGGLTEAVAAAAKLGKIEVAAGATPRVRYIETEPGRLQRWLQRLGLDGAADVVTGAEALLAPPDAGTTLRHMGSAALGSTLGPVAGPALASDLAWLAELLRQGDPLAAQAHCLCAAP